MGALKKHTSKIKYRQLALAIPILACLIIVSCAGIVQKDRVTPGQDERFVECRYVEDEKDKESSMLRCSIGYDRSNFFTGIGNKLTMIADSGERLELWWTIDWLGRGYFFPRWRFALMYFNPQGTEKQQKGVRIGECRFSRGCNHGRYTGPDLNKNNIPDYFTEIVWDNYDYGDDAGVEGYLDHYQHIYKPRENLYEVIRYLYFYPEKCTPPLSPRDDVCCIKNECKPPYKIKERRIIESIGF